MRRALLIAGLGFACGRAPSERRVPHGRAAAPPAEVPAATALGARQARGRAAAWSAAFRTRSRAADFEPAPDVVVHAPAGFDPSRPVHLVVLFHGLGAQAMWLAGGGLPDPVTGRPVVGWGLEVRHDMAASNTLLVALQFDDRRGHPRLGRFAQRGFFRRFLTDLLEDTLAPRIGRHGLDDLAAMTLVGSSAGGPAIAALLALGDLDDRIRDVVFFDAMYGGEAAIDRWLRGGTAARPRRFVCIHGGSRHTQPVADRLAARLRPWMAAGLAVQPEGPITAAVRAHRAVFAVVSCEHVCMMGAYLDKVLRGLDLPPRTPDPDPKTPVAGAAPQGSALRAGEAARGVLDEADARMVDGSAYEDHPLDLAAGERVTLDLRGGRARGYLCYLLDVEVRVLDRGRVVADDDDSGGALRARLAFTASHAGRYTVRVMAHGPWSNYGPWTLAVAR